MRDERWGPKSVGGWGSHVVVTVLPLSRAPFRLLTFIPSAAPHASVRRQRVLPPRTRSVFGLRPIPSRERGTCAGSRKGVTKDQVAQNGQLPRAQAPIRRPETGAARCFVISSTSTQNVAARRRRESIASGNRRKFVLNPSFLLPPWPRPRLPSRPAGTDNGAAIETSER